MTETRKISSGDLRRLCIAKNWYTRGDNEAYGKLLNHANDCSENVQTADIVKLAEDILQHSDTEHPLSSICYEIAKICSSFFYE